MKTFNIYIMIAALFVINNNAISQTDFICQMYDTCSFDFSESGDCYPEQNGPWSFFRNKNSYIPYLDPNYPLQNPEIMTIQVNINIIQKDDGSGNYPNNQATIDRMKTIIGWVNSFYSSYSPSDPINWVTELPSYDSKIRFSLGEAGNERIFFYQNTSAWDDMFPSQTIEPFIQQNYPERLEQVNVYIFGNPNNNNWAHASMPSNYDFNRKSWVVLFTWDIVGDWAKAGTLAHEFGHNLNLLHTYYGGGASAICNQLHEDFLQDIFLIEQPNISNCPHTCNWSANAYNSNGDGITNNLMGGNQSAAYIGPMQAGQMHRALAISSVRKYVTCEKSSLPFTIDDEQLWDFNLKLYRDLVINSGAQLTIKCKLIMHPNAKIVVKQGATLILDGGTITTDVYEKGYWRGIEVWGTKDSSQIARQGQPLYQGKLILKNGAVIENAHNAITLWKPNDWYSMGGIVQAEDAFFYNNRRSVEFMSYQNKHPYSGAPMGNISYFKNCHFEVNDDYFVPSPFFAHISMWHVDGINIYSCNFINNMTNNPNTGVGIVTENAFFNVLPTCSSQVTPCPANDIVPNTFQGLHYGIHSASSGVDTKTINIKNAEFTGNNYGIKLNNINNATIINSTFNVGGYLGGEAECGFLYGVGIELLNCTGFAIEENSFYKVYGDPDGYFVGTYIAETQSADQVYRNTFYNLSYGNYAVGKNWKGTETWQGLAYYCNQNTWNRQDITVAMDIYNQGGIQSPIGSPSLPAGNTFSTNADYHIYNGGNHWLGYFYYAPSPGYTGTSYYPARVYRVIREEVVGIQNQCPPNYGGGGSASERDLVLTPAQKQQEEIVYAAALSDYNNVKTLYDNLKDGGSTTATLTDIATAWPSDMWQLRAELLGKSPHLSMEALKAAADKTDVLPESIIFEILAANPDELQKDELINYLEDKQNPLPEYMVDILRQVAMGSSYKTVLQRQMANYSQEKARAAHNIIRSLLNDTISNNDELRNWFDNIGGKRADEQIIATYMSESNFTNALSLANMMPSLYNYKENELDEHNYYMQMLNLQIDLAQQQRTIFDLDNTEVANLVFIAGNSTGTAGAQAKGILEFAYGYHFYNCIDPEESGMKSGKYLNPFSPEKIYGIEIIARPNPAKAWVAFNYTLPSNDPQGVIKISDLSGKEIASIPISGKQGQQIWDTRAVKPGVYFYTLNTAGFSKHGKIVISQ